LGPFEARWYTWNCPRAACQGEGRGFTGSTPRGSPLFRGSGEASRGSSPGTFSPTDPRYNVATSSPIQNWTDKKERRTCRLAEVVDGLHSPLPDAHAIQLIIKERALTFVKSKTLANLAPKGWFKMEHAKNNRTAVVDGSRRNVLIGSAGIAAVAILSAMTGAAASTSSNPSKEGAP
jgi:hypothetical protein